MGESVIGEYNHATLALLLNFPRMKRGRFRVVEKANLLLIYG